MTSAGDTIWNHSPHPPKNLHPLPLDIRPINVALRVGVDVVGLLEGAAPGQEPAAKGEDA